MAAAKQSETVDETVDEPTGEDSVIVVMTRSTLGRAGGEEFEASREFALWAVEQGIAKIRDDD